ncbi:MAG: anti-sigma factor [Candidatus Nanopelagicales bacterium]
MSRPCSQRDADLAVLAMGALDESESLALLSHVGGCPLCATTLAELRSTVAALDTADPDRLDPVTAPPAGLDARVLAAVDREAKRHQLAVRITRWAAAAAAAVLMLAGVGWMISSRGEAPGEDGTTVAFASVAGSEPQVSGTATVTGRAWGTEVILVVGGTEPGTVYRVWLADGSGQRTPAGTFRGADRTLEVTVASALPLPQATSIGMTTETADPLVLVPVPQA